VVNRSAIVPERSAMNVNFPTAINIKVFVHLAEGGLHQYLRQGKQ
jgi:hypothetical protein